MSSLRRTLRCACASWVILLLIGDFSLASHPAADPSAVVIAKHARFTVLTSQLIRMEWHASFKFRDCPTMTMLNRHLPVPGFTIEQNHSWIVITTSHLQLSYMFTSARSFYSGNLRVALSNFSTLAVEWTPGSLADDDEGRLPGTIRTLDGVDGALDLDCSSQAHRDDLHCTMGLVSRRGFVVVDDTNAVELDDSQWPWVRKEGKSAPPEAKCNMDMEERRQCGTRLLSQEECEDEGCCYDDVISSCFYSSAATQDLYFLGHGHNYKHALKEFTWLSGPVPIPPRFAFGVFFSQYWAFSDVGLESVVHAFEQHSVPLDVVVIDMDWHVTFYGEKAVDQAGQKKGWTGFTWDKRLFPDPEQFIAKLHSLGLKVTLNLHPASGVQPWEDSYQTVAELMGIDPSSERYVPMRMTHKPFAEVWLNHTLGLRELEGVDFWWLDWQQGEGWIEVLENISNLNPTIWLNYMFFTNPNRWSGSERPLILHRWGGLGNHRYPFGFSGDVEVSWESLRFQPYFTAMAANVAYGYWSHDIGGHTAPTDPELYTRWIQWGVFSPVFRTHCTKNPLIKRLIWKYDDEYEEIMREAMVLRASLLPYIYTQAWHTRVSGLSMVRGLYFDFPAFEEAYSSSSSQYMFGDDFLLTPITHPVDPATGLAVQQIWVPPGSWVDVSAGLMLKGPSTLRRSYTLSEIPILVKSGAVIPRKGAAEARRKVLGSSREIPRSIAFWVMPGAATGSGELYEDDGESEGYLKGEHAITTWSFAYSDDMSTLSFAITQPEGASYHGMPSQREYEIAVYASWPAKHVTVNSVDIEERKAGRGRHKESEAVWAYDGSHVSLTVHTGVVPAGEKVIVEIELQGSNNDPRLLSGFVGESKRLQQAKEMLDGQFGTVFMDWYPTFLSAAASASRITFDPSTAEEELTWFGGICSAGLDEISRLKALDPGVKTKILAMFECRGQPHALPPIDSDDGSVA
mmetsp:Transcript_59686/g.140550  ORF Transcript_59686/g.140550 Transcript_59686/m.140550 type:complete len:966 (+) Transcript_59686:118-3015(+)